MSERRISRSFFSGMRMKVLAILVTTAIVLSILLSTLMYLPPASAPEMRMTLLGDGVQKVGHGESALYSIDVENIADTGKLFELELTDAPEKWGARLYDDSGSPGAGSENLLLDMSAGSHEIVYLMVTAPSLDAAEEAQKNGHPVDRVAAIGVRGDNENVTIGTVTVLFGDLQLKRYEEGEPVTVNLTSVDEPYEARSGDIINATGYAEVKLNFSKLSTNDTVYEGELYVGLTNATVGFLYNETSEIVYMGVQKGKALVFKKDDDGGGGGGGTATRQPVTRDAASDWMMGIGSDPELDTQLPSLAPNAFLSFGPDAPELLLSMDVDQDGGATASVFSGSLLVENDLESITLNEYQTTRAASGDNIPDPEPVHATMIEIDSDGSTNEVVQVDGEDIFSHDQTHVLTNMEGRSIYIIPTTEDDDMDISVIQQGRSEGEYRTRFTTLEEYSVRSFQFSSTSSASTRDIISISQDMIKIDSEEEDKTYDLSIAYREKDSDVEEYFNLTEIETSDEEQALEVEDWDALADENLTSGFIFKDGDTEVEVEEGQSWDEVKEKIDDKNKLIEDAFELPMYVWAGLMVVTLMVIMGAFMTLGRKEEDEETLFDEEDEFEEAGESMEEESHEEPMLLQPMEEEEETSSEGEDEQEEFSQIKMPDGMKLRIPVIPLKKEPAAPIPQAEEEEEIIESGEDAGEEEIESGEYPGEETVEEEDTEAPGEEQILHEPMSGDEDEVPGSMPPTIPAGDEMVEEEPSELPGEPVESIEREQPEAVPSSQAVEYEEVTDETEDVTGEPDEGAVSVEEIEREELPGEVTDETDEGAVSLEEIEREELPGEVTDETEDVTDEPDEGAVSLEEIEREELPGEVTDEIEDVADEPDEGAVSLDDPEEDEALAPFKTFKTRRRDLESWYDEWQKEMDDLF